MRWDKTISVLRAWQPHIVLCQEISAAAPGGLRAHLWTTANTLGMIPLLGPPSPGSLTGNHPAVLVTASARPGNPGRPAPWPPGAGTQPAWCEALVQVPGWAHPLRAYSVDLPWRSSVEQRSQADQLATRIAELAGPANWPSPEATGIPTAAPTRSCPPRWTPRRCTCGRPGCGTHPRTGP